MIRPCAQKCPYCGGACEAKPPHKWKHIHYDHTTWYAVHCWETDAEGVLCRD